MRAWFPMLRSSQKLQRPREERTFRTSHVSAFRQKPGSYFSMSTVREISRGPIKPLRPLTPQDSDKQSCRKAALDRGNLPSEARVRLCSTAQTWPFLLFSMASCNSGAQVLFNSFSFSSGCPTEDTQGAAATEASCRDRVCGALDRFFLIKTLELHRSNEAQSHATVKLLRRRIPEI